MLAYRKLNTGVVWKVRVLVIVTEEAYAYAEMGARASAEGGAHD